VAIADVSRKGTPAALLVASVHATLEALPARPQPEPDREASRTGPRDLGSGPAEGGSWLVPARAGPRM